MPDASELPTLDSAFDLAASDDSLTPLEKVYLFSRSQATYHRSFIATHLVNYLDQISPEEAVDYVLPLLSGLAMDEEDSVREGMAKSFGDIAWWFFTHCKVVLEDEIFYYDENEGAPEASTSSAQVPEVKIGVQAFTPILGTLLLNSNAIVGGHARYAVVDIIGRIRDADAEDDETPRAEEEGQEKVRRDVGMFGREQRRLVQSEIIDNVVIGMGRLDLPFVDPDTGEPEQPPTNEGEDDEYQEESSIDAEQAAIGRLSSMSLIAAVTAGGSLDLATQEAFVHEVERVGRDPLFYWVRREASFALGALAKVVPVETVVCSLVGRIFLPPELIICMTRD
jgi:hypothetical protein